MPSSYHHGDVPRAILAAARDLLERVPITELSVRELARVTGVSHAAPYRHFGDKAGFLGALTGLCLDEFVDVQVAALEDAPPGDKLPAVGRAYVRFAVDHPFVFDLLYNPRTGAPLHHPAVQAALLRHGELFRAALADAEASGQLPPDADMVAAGFAVWSAAHGLAHLVTAGFAPTEDVDAILISMLRAGTPRPGGEERGEWVTVRGTMNPPSAPPPEA